MNNQESSVSVGKKKAKFSNGNPNKKIIKLSELKTNMDPLEYFSRFLDIPEMVFNNLGGKDLIAISEINQNYYNFIASSKVFMKKVKVVFRENRVLHPEDSVLLKNSSRLYQSIEVKRCIISLFKARDRYFITHPELDFFHDKPLDWKNVSMRDIYFKDRIDLWKFLLSFESSVESLSVLVNDIMHSQTFEDQSSDYESFKALKFPNLKELKLNYQDIWGDFSETLARFLLSCVAIEKLEFLRGVGIFQQGIVRKMLVNFDKLTCLKLKVAGHVGQETFEGESWRQFRFKLKSLTIIIGQHHRRPNFLNFLKSQSDYLEVLSIDPSFNNETFRVIMKMPKLKSFCIHDFRTFSVNEVPNEISTTITDLRLKYLVDAISLKFLLHSMPNVKKLELYSIDEEKLKMLKSINRKFEELRVFNLIKVDKKELEEIVTKNCHVENYNLKCLLLSRLED